MQAALLSLPVTANMALFGALALGVWFAGSRLTYLADALSDRLSFAKSMTGFVFLALATSLPEVATTLGAAARQGADLVLNNLFGGVALQTAILATADLWARRAISSYPRKATHALEAALLIGLLSVAAIAVQLGEPLAFGHVGVGAIVIASAYVAALWLLRRYDGANDWTPVDLPGGMVEQTLASYQVDERTPNVRLMLLALAACAAILVCGLGLVGAAEALASQTGLGAGFVGATLLAGATSLPELTTTVTAVRMGAYTLAISNIFGSNLIMLVLVAPADALYTAGPILRDAGPTVPLAIGFGVFVTAVYIVGMIVRRKPSFGRLGFDSMIVLAAFIVSVVAYYWMSNVG